MTNRHSSPSLQHCSSKPEFELTVQHVLAPSFHSVPACTAATACMHPPQTINVA